MCQSPPVVEQGAVVHVLIAIRCPRRQYDPQQQVALRGALQEQLGGCGEQGQAHSHRLLCHAMTHPLQQVWRVLQHQPGVWD